MGIGPYGHTRLWAYSTMGIPTYPDIGMEAVRPLAGLHSSLADLAGPDYSLHCSPEDAQEVPPLPDIDAVGAVDVAASAEVGRVVEVDIVGGVEDDSAAGALLLLWPPPPKKRPI